MDNRLMYRIWDKENKTYESPDAPFYLCEDGTILDKHFDIRNKDVKIEFSTGLKDKNGKLIYEGDILRINNREIHPVEYMDCYAQFHIEGHGVVESFFSNTYEVIGNIYENQELLKGLQND